MNVEDFAIFIVTLAIAFTVYAFVFRRKRSAKSVQRLNVALSSMPIVTIAANHILLDSDFKISSSARKMLSRLSQRACIYVIVMAANMDQAQLLRDPIINELKKVLSEDRLLFCQTAIGRASMTRQLEPIVHFDFDPEVVHQISFFFNAVLISSAQVDAPHALCQCRSFEEFMGKHLQRLFPILAA
jgi:hypothetical protein